MNAYSPFSFADKRTEVMHYTGSVSDRGGVMSVIDGLAGTGRFQCVLGVNSEFEWRRPRTMPLGIFPDIEPEAINPLTIWRAKRVALYAQTWLRHGEHRVFHAHSRAGLLATLWLAQTNLKRAVVSVHCYGRQRWFYRWAARRLGGRLYWLSPAMKRYYGVYADDGWAQCIPGCVPQWRGARPSRRARAGVLRLGGIGSIVRWKGWHVIVEALALLPREVREKVRFDHIGAPASTWAARRYAAELRAATARHGLEQVISWRGEAASSAPLLREIDCLVVASDHEPFSIAMLESLAANVPVLAADSGGAQDLVVEGQSGWFFRSGDAARLAEKIRALVESDALERVNITDELIRPFTAPVVAKRWQQVYDALEMNTEYHLHLLKDLSA